MPSKSDTTANAGSNMCAVTKDGVRMTFTGVSSEQLVFNVAEGWHQIRQTHPMATEG